MVHRHIHVRTYIDNKPSFVWNFQQWNFSLPPEKKNHESWLRLLDVLCHCHERVIGKMAR
jgi:hypothetical protein